MKRWTRYGHDRLYVQTRAGDRLGYWDLKTATAVVEPGADRDAFDAALAAHAPAGGPAIPVPAPADQSAPAPGPLPDATTASGSATTASDDTQPAEDPGAQDDATLDAAEAGPTPDGPSCTDLAAVRPGAAAREQALALRQAAPVRTFLARALGVKTDERAWRIGADGEEAVAARLARLGDRWKVLHAVPIGDRGSDIDHVVIGPAGVFTVNAKHHPDATVWVGGDTFMVNGQRVPYVRNSRHEARRAAKLLTAAGAGPVSATGLIAVMGARGGFTVKTQPDGVVVTTRKEIGKWLARQPETLTDEQVDALYEIARRSDTWR